MGYTINHSKTTKIIPRKYHTSKASKLVDILPSGSWKGKRCFVICGGPSLVDFDFTLLSNELTIGVNKSFTKFSSTICYAMDERFYSSITYPNKKNVKSVLLHNQWKQYTGIKVFARFSDKVKFGPEVYVVDNISKKVISYDIGVGIYTGNNSGFGALMLAIGLGSSEIYLLGCDMSIDNKSKRSHWHDGYSHQRLASLPSKLKSFRRCFEEFSDDIKKQGIQVVNLNPDSALNCFDKSSIQSILR